MIPKEVIANIMKSADIVDIISRYLKVEKRGANFFAVCPFHDDTRPSLTISPTKQIFTCFACGATGNVFTFVQKYEKVSFIDAVKKVATFINFQDPSLQNSTNSGVPQEDKPLYEALEEMKNYYHLMLTTKVGGEALNYLQERGMNLDLINYFSLGYAPHDAESSIKMLRQKNYDVGTLEKVGIITPGQIQFKDRYVNRVMFPLFNDVGKTVGFSGRRLNEDDESKYINSPETVVFQKSDLLYNIDKATTEAKRLNLIYIVEGFMDVIACYKAGILNVVALMGTAFTLSHLAKLKKLNVELRFALDADQAGISATRRIIEMLINETVKVSIVDTKDAVAKDADDIFNKIGGDGLKDYLSHSLTELDFILGFDLDGFKKGTALDKEKFLESLTKFVAKIHDPVEFDEFMSRLSHDTNITLQTLKKFYHPPGLKNDTTIVPLHDIDKREVVDYLKIRYQHDEYKEIIPLEVRVFGAILKSNEALELFRQSSQSFFNTPVLGELYFTILDSYLSKVPLEQDKIELSLQIGSVSHKSGEFKELKTTLDGLFDYRCPKFNPDNFQLLLKTLAKKRQIIAERLKLRDADEMSANAKSHKVVIVKKIPHKSTLDNLLSKKGVTHE